METFRVVVTIHRDVYRTVRAKTEAQAIRKVKEQIITKPPRFKKKDMEGETRL